MSTNPPILIIDEDSEGRAILEKMLGKNALYKDLCLVKGSGDFDRSDEDLPPLQNWIVLGDKDGFDNLKDSQIFEKPVRMGAILDRITYLINQGDRAEEAELIQIASWEFDVSHSRLEHSESKREIRLTDKERDILQILHKHTDQSVSREALLEEVWGYVEGVETHTLETHIYRLRQKIEKDPAQPEILLTKDDGYSLKL